MIKSSLLILCLIFIAGASSTSRSFQAEQTHGQWLRERYEEATSIKVGMTRADLKKLFYEDGGLQSVPEFRYVLKSSGLIKVDVEFDSPEGMNHRTATDELIHIKSISKPYLEEMFLD
jgi:hypothetical protein